MIKGIGNYFTMSRLLAQKYRLAGMALLLVFASYWCGITLFTHSHVVNGVIVVHSHPFKAGHTHTDTQLETIFYLSLLQTSGETNTSVALPCWLIPLGLILFVCTAGVPYRPVCGHPHTRSSLSLIFAGHTLSVYKSRKHLLI